MDFIITLLSVVTKDLPISPRFTPYDFLSRCKFSTLTPRQPTAEFYLLTFPRFPLRKKEHKSYFGKNRTHDFRTSGCAGYLLDHSGNELAIADLIHPLSNNRSSIGMIGCLLGCGQGTGGEKRRVFVFVSVSVASCDSPMTRSRYHVAGISPMIPEHTSNNSTYSPGTRAQTLL